MDFLVQRGVAVIVPGYLKYSTIELTGRKLGSLAPQEWVELFTRELLDLPLDEIARAYTCVSVRSEDPEGLYLNLFVRRDRLDDVWRERPPSIAVADCFSVRGD
jgi:hypothetical protein